MQKLYEVTGRYLCNSEVTVLWTGFGVKEESNSSD